jgi:hypothetical protein
MKESDLLKYDLQMLKFTDFDQGFVGFSKVMQVTMLPRSQCRIAPSLTGFLRSLAGSPRASRLLAPNLLHPCSLLQCCFSSPWGDLAGSVLCFLGVLQHTGWSPVSGHPCIPRMHATMLFMSFPAYCSAWSSLNCFHHNISSQAHFVLDRKQPLLVEPPGTMST